MRRASVRACASSHASRSSAIRSPAWPSHSGGPSAGIGTPSARIASDAAARPPRASTQPVRAVGDRDRSLRVGPDGQARARRGSSSPPGSRRVGHDERRAADQRQEVDVAERVDDAQPVVRRRRPAASSVGRPRGWSGHDERHAARRRRAASRRSGAAWAGSSTLAGRWMRGDRVGARAGRGAARMPRRRRTGRGSPAACRSSGCRRSGSARPGCPRGEVVDALGDWSRTAARDSRSVTRRLISSGIVSSKLRRPASTWATGRTELGRHERRRHRRVDVAVDDDERRPESAANVRSRATMSAAVWPAWVPDPTPRLMSGSGRPRSRKKTSDIAAS